jgi:hypothetical protein
MPEQPQTLAPAKHLPQVLLRRGLRLTSKALHDNGGLLHFYDIHGYVPNLVHPRTFNEKVYRFKMTADPAKLAPLADKVRVQDYVRERIGPEVLNEIYLVTTDPAEIRFDRLPESFVVKANHGSGWDVLVPDKSHASEAAVQAECRRWLNLRFGLETHERWYSAIPPQILVERFLHDDRYTVPLDYKFWVFGGTAHYIQVDIDRFGSHQRVFYDRNWVRQAFTICYPPGPDVPRPEPLDRMIAIAERLATGLSFVRVDLYAVNGHQIIFGELTFAPGAGFEPFLPDGQVDTVLGRLWP